MKSLPTSPFSRAAPSGDFIVSRACANTPSGGALDFTIGPDAGLLCVAIALSVAATPRSGRGRFNAVINATLAVTRAAIPVRMPGSVVQNIQNPPRRAACDVGLVSESGI